MSHQRLRQIGEAAKRRRQRRRQRVMRVVVPILFVLALLGAQLGITLQNYYANRAEALKLSDQVVASVSDRIVRRVDAFLTPAARMTELFARRGGKPSSGEWDPRQLEPLGREIIATFEQLAMVNIGTPRGEFVMPKQMPDGSIDTKLIERDGSSPTVRWIRRDPQGVKQRVEPTPFEGYDPRQRPWYQGALKNEGLYWTDPYLFFTGKIPGVTAGFPIRGESGELRAVVGVDIELEDLSRFLSTLQIGKQGRAAIVNTKGHLIAHPRFPRLANQAEDTSTIHLSALDDAGLLRAFNTYRVQGAGATEARLNGEPYRLTSRRLPARLGQNWLVLVAVPENDFVGFVGENNRRTLILSLAVLGVGALLAGLLAVQGIRADRNAQLVLEQRERLEAQSQATSALAQDPNVLDADEPAGLARLTEAATEAAVVQRASVWLLDGSQLRCIESFDTTTREHATGTAIDRGKASDLLGELEHQPVIATAQARSMSILSALHRLYLGPLGMQSALLAPIRAGGQLVGVLMLEDANATRDWPSDTENFAQNLAAMLAVRFRMHAREAATEALQPTGTSDTPAARSAPRHPAPTVAEAKLERCCDTTALVIECDQRPDHEGMTHDSDDDASTRLTPFTLINRLVCCIDAWRDAFGVTNVSAMDQRIVVIGEAAEPTQSAERMASLALELQAHARLHDPADDVAVRMGLHTDDLTRASLGTSHELQELAGPAVRLATFLANLGMRDQIQVSEATCHLIHDRFLLQGRGRFYADPFGEFQVFLLHDVQARAEVSS